MIDEAREEFFARFPVSRETQARLDAFADLVRRAGARQNLVAQSTVPMFWRRHMLDSAQLLPLSPAAARTWLDVGTGAGLPGLVLAIMTNATHVLLEPRRLRAEFLVAAAATLGIAQRVTVVQKRVESFAHSPFDIITARAFAPLTKTIEAIRHLSAPGTTWLLHKGRSARLEVEDAAAKYDADFQLIPSLTEPDASIVRVTRWIGERS